MQNARLLFQSKLGDLLLRILVHDLLSVACLVCYLFHRVLQLLQEMHSLKFGKRTAFNQAVIKTVLGTTHSNHIS